MPNPSIFPGPGKNLWRLQLGDYILAVADFKTRTAPQNTKYVNGFRRFMNGFVRDLAYGVRCTAAAPASSRPRWYGGGPR